MADPDPIKPFSPEETRRIMDHLQRPAVFLNMTHSWPALRWTAEHLSGRLGDKLIRFRLGRKEETNTPLFETQCSYVEAKLGHFLSWTRGQTGTDVGPFLQYPQAEYWAYADYKYIAMLFQDQPSMFEDVKWSEFGFEGRGGRESTLWVGTEGANTPCHLDSYGCNLVLQVQGRKRWHLFPPEDTGSLYPTRIPYEESSVFSRVDVLRPDSNRFPAFKQARAHVVTLQPGQVLFVPRHWWHYVESVDPVTVSVNSWIELEEDDVARVSEAVTKAVVCAIKSVPSGDNEDNWLNPTEEAAASHNDNMQYVNLAVRSLAQGRGREPPTRDRRDARTGRKRDSSGQIRENENDSAPESLPSGVPFGPHLVPVRPQRENSLQMSESDVESQVKRTAGLDASQRNEEPSTVGLQQGNKDHGSGLTSFGACDCDRADTTGSSEDYEQPIRTTITTNDLLDCLVHPDVIAQVTRLLLERHTGSHTHSKPS